MIKKLKLAVLLALMIFQCLVLSGCKAQETVETLLAQKVEFSCGRFPVNVEVLVLTVNEDELVLLDEFSQLKSLDLSGSTCYAEIGRWAENHPHIELSCELPLPNGQTVQLMDKEVDLSGLDRAHVSEAAELLNAMPQLESVQMGEMVSGTEPLTFDDLLCLEADLPEVIFDWDKFSFDLFGNNISLQDTELDLSKISSDDVALALELISHMPKLEFVELGGERDSLGLEDASKFQRDFPEIDKHFEFSLYDQSFNIDVESMDFSFRPISDDGEALRSTLPYLLCCNYVDMDSCGISSERMGNLQAEFPDVKLVWRVFFGHAYTLRTDEERLLASSVSQGGNLTSELLADLKYCTDLKYLDLGHNITIRDLSFLSTLTKLEVVILAMNSFTDVSPLANSPNIEYLELYTSELESVEPLRNMTKLRHLNIGGTNVSDISPLYGLELERLWIGCRTPVPAEQVAEMQALHPDCQIDTKVTDPSHGLWRYARTNCWPWPLHERYALLREQMGHNTLAYNFKWSDEKYWAYYTGNY